MMMLGAIRKKFRLWFSSGCTNPEPQQTFIGGNFMKSIRPLASQTTNKRKSLKYQWPWFVLILLLAGGASAWYFFWGPGAKQSSNKTGTQTYTAAVKRGDLTISASGSGKLVAYQSVDLSFSTSGTVSELKVKLGDLVKAGQVLASLGSSETLDANLAAARLQVLQAQKTLSDLQSSADLSLAQSYSNLITAQQTYAAALKKSQRTAIARCGQDTTTRLLAALDQATKKLDSIHAETPGSDVYIRVKKSYDTALANYNYCAAYTADEKTSAQSTLEVTKNALQDAQDTYDTLKAASGIDPNTLALDEANLKKAQAQLAKAEDELAGITLTAPIDGKITYLAASAGTLVDTSKFITIADVSHAMLDLSVDESDLQKLMVDSAVKVSFDALPDLTFTGKVTQVNPAVTTSGQYRIAKGLALLDDNATKTVATLPLGLSATVTIVNHEAKNTLLVPVIALKSLGDNSYGVMVQSSDGQLKLTVVTVGIQDKDYAQITSGLQEGDLVSTGTVNFIAAGSSSNSSSLKNAQDAGGPGGFPGAP
jgi:HlyD family secretion protein